MKWTALIVALGVVVAGAGLGAEHALAQGQDAAQIISKRQEAMKQQGRELVAVRNYLQGKGDKSTAIAGLEAVEKSVPTVPSLFPPGTGIGEVSAKTRAKPEIWREHDKFLAAEKTVADQIAALDAAVRSDDKAKAETLFKQIGYCAGCHDTFRAKEKKE